MVRKSLWFLAIACVYAVALGQSAHAGPPPAVPEIDPGSFGSAADHKGLVSSHQKAHRRAEHRRVFGPVF